MRHGYELILSCLMPHHSCLLGERHKLRIPLMRSFPSEEIVVAAAGAVGIFVADSGASLIDRAAARLRIEEHARASIDLVFVMAEDDFAFGDLREAALRGFEVDTEVARQSIDIALR